MVPFRYRNRTDAGTRLAEVMLPYEELRNLVVLALPRGGVPVAFEVARRLRAPLDVYVVRKLGVPGHEELAMGAVAGDGTVIADETLIEALGVTHEEFNEVVRRELDELHRRENAYREGRAQHILTGKTAVCVDDGLATGSSMRAAVSALRRRDPASIVVAVPVAAARTCAELRKLADEIVCPFTPEPFGAVGLYYDDFGQTSDEEVRSLLHRAAELEARRWKVA